MVKKMNKEIFIEELSKETKLDHNTCSKINNILEENFFISKSSKEKIISNIIRKIGFNKEQSEKIYNSAVSITNKEYKKILKEQ